MLLDGFFKDEEIKSYYMKEIEKDKDLIDGLSELSALMIASSIFHYLPKTINKSKYVKLVDVVYRLSVSVGACKMLKNDLKGLRILISYYKNKKNLKKV